MNKQLINDSLNGIEKHIRIIREHINKPEPEQRPEPKFKEGQMTDKGRIKSCTFIGGTNKYSYWVLENTDYPYFEYELTAVPSIEITLFECFWNGGKTEVRTVNTDNKFTLNPNAPFNKDKVADYYFQQGKCAILIAKDGKSERRYHEAIEALYPELTGWQEIGVHPKTIEGYINISINHPKFLVESNGEKLRAYRMKDGRVQVEIGKDNYWKFQDRDEFLAALGFKPDNIMPAILHGKG